MDYLHFKQLADIHKRLLTLLNVISTENAYIKINSNPNDTFSKELGRTTGHYQFKSHWDFSHKYLGLTEAELLEKSILHSEDIIKLQKDYNIKTNSWDYATIIHLANEYGANVIDNEGMRSNEDLIKLNDLQIYAIDNYQKKLYYQGSLTGDNTSIHHIDWEIVAKLKIAGISIKQNLPLYKFMLAESYLLYQESKYKKSYERIHSALESFVDSNLEAPDQKIGSKEKLNLAYKNKFDNWDNHEVYTSIRPIYENLTENRNSIAHKIAEMEISKSEVEEAILVILLLIFTYEFEAQSFDEICSKLLS